MAESVFPKRFKRVTQPIVQSFKALIPIKHCHETDFVVIIGECVVSVRNLACTNLVKAQNTVRPWSQSRSAPLATECLAPLSCDSAWSWIRSLTDMNDSEIPRTWICVCASLLRFPPPPSPISLPVTSCYALKTRVKRLPPPPPTAPHPPKYIQGLSWNKTDCQKLSIIYSCMLMFDFM